MLLPNHFKALILDMDGVLWKADTPIGDLTHIFRRIHQRGLKYAFATNNGTRTPEQYVKRLIGFGVPAEPWQVVTSALGVAELLGKRFNLNPPLTSSIKRDDDPRVKTKVFVIGEAGVITALHKKGFEVLTVEQAAEAEAVVMGIDRNISFEKMVAATLLVRKNVPFYATNSDKTFPTPSGEIPGAGAWISVVISSTGIEPIYAGKPSPTILELARERLGTKKEETLVIGDRLETDIAGGQNAGMPVALVLSGVTQKEWGLEWKPSIDIIADDLEQLIG